MMTMMIHEIFDKIKSTPKNEDKAAVLRQSDSPAIREVLRYGLHPNVKFFTNVMPAYKRDDSPDGLSLSSLFTEYKRLYIFLAPDQERSQSGKVTTEKRKMELLISMLESIHPEEADLIVYMLTGVFSKKTTVTKKVVELAFPGLIPQS